jgi:hypothetical protein
MAYHDQVVTSSHHLQQQGLDPRPIRLSERTIKYECLEATLSQSTNKYLHVLQNTSLVEAMKRILPSPLQSGPATPEAKADNLVMHA